MGEGEAQRLRQAGDTGAGSSTVGTGGKMHPAGLWEKLASWRVVVREGTGQLPRGVKAEPAQDKHGGKDCGGTTEEVEWPT